MRSSRIDSAKAMWNRSRKGAENRSWYFEMRFAEHVHAKWSCPENPHGQGLAAPITSGLGGDSRDHKASMGLRSPSRVRTGISPNSSRNKTPDPAAQNAPLAPMS
jgi:hypothetical protein